MVTKVTTESTKIHCAISKEDYITISGVKPNYAVIATTIATTTPSLGTVTHIVLDEGRAQMLIDTLKEHFDL